ncbi:MAG TPA: hypothetical protein VMB26_08090 [Candidatus Binataceae bacterium]|nr:hypothetical protein [Candidatus Binataceae bacterium]
MRILTVAGWRLFFACALLLNGCAAAALLPMGFQAVEAAGAITGASITGKNPDEDPDKTESDPQSAECQQLLTALPYIAEVRAQPGQAPRIRQMTIGVVKGEQRWTVVHDADSDGNGWRTESALTQLDFNPPLESALASTKSRYMITAPADPTNQAEANQLMTFTLAFGPRVGTYDWNGKRYEYSVTRKLPCLPAPAPEPGEPNS